FLIRVVDNDDCPTGRLKGLVPAPITQPLRFQQVMAAVVLDSNFSLSEAEVSGRRTWIPGAKPDLQLGFGKAGVQHG
ncbi:hypothetical protein ACTHPR_11300, partial [Micrococcus luteus]|uniref:hypothetical protein n=1 Tax=Micrococcus luteus TaxID=1270 RepID=UPI003F7F7CF2